MSKIGSIGAMQSFKSNAPVQNEESKSSAGRIAAEAAGATAVGAGLGYAGYKLTPYALAETVINKTINKPLAKLVEEMAKTNSETVVNVIAENLENVKANIVGTVENLPKTVPNMPESMKNSAQGFVEDIKNRNIPKEELKANIENGQKMIKQSVETVKNGTGKFFRGYKLGHVGLGAVGALALYGGAKYLTSQNQSNKSLV